MHSGVCASQQPMRQIGSDESSSSEDENSATFIVHSAPFEVDVLALRRQPEMVKLGQSLG
jgi:hypothetical protein